VSGCRVANGLLHAADAGFQRLDVRAGKVGRMTQLRDGLCRHAGPCRHLVDSVARVGELLHGGGQRSEDRRTRADEPRADSAGYGGEGSQTGRRAIQPRLQFVAEHNLDKCLARSDFLSGHALPSYAAGPGVRNVIFLRFEGRTHEGPFGILGSANADGLAGSHAAHAGSPTLADLGLANLHRRAELVDLRHGRVAQIGTKERLLIELHWPDDERFRLRLVGEQNVLERGDAAKSPSANFRQIGICETGESEKNGSPLFGDRNTKSTERELPWKASSRVCPVRSSDV
jgi:hypothetical protein